MTTMLLGERLIVEKIEPEAMKGAIHLPTNVSHDHYRGTVRMVGTGVYDFATGQTRPLHVNVGDIVVYGKYSGQGIEIGGIKGTLLVESDIIAIERASE